MRAASLAAYTIAGLILLATAVGNLYSVGIVQTVLGRASGTDSASAVLANSARWTAPVLAAAIAGLVICAATERERSKALLLFVLSAAALLVPVEQARIHTLTSLDKHADFGAWFAAMAAGYAASKLCALLPQPSLRTVTCGACAAALVFPAIIGWKQAQVVYGWANSTRFVAALRPLVQHDPGPLLVETPSPARYYLGATVPWQRWSSTWSVILPGGKTTGAQSGLGAPGKAAVYDRLIKRHFFAVIALDWEATQGLDQQIAANLSRDYRYVASIPYGAGRYVIWRRTGMAASR